MLTAELTRADSRWKTTTTTDHAVCHLLAVAAAEQTIDQRAHKRAVVHARGEVAAVDLIAARRRLDARVVAAVFLARLPARRAARGASLVPSRRAHAQTTATPRA